MKKLLGWLILFPVLFMVAVCAVNLFLAILSGDISLVQYIQEHSILIALVGAYLFYRFVLVPKM